MARCASIMLVAVAACSSAKTEHVRTRDDAAAVAAAAPIDAPAPCPGNADDCAKCMAGEGPACTRIAVDVSPDRAKLEWYTRACDGGDPDGCDGLAWVYVSVVPDHDAFVRAQERQKELERKRADGQMARCENDHDEEACMSYGLAIAFGKGGIAKDTETAIRVLEASCARHYLRSCVSLTSLELPPAQIARYGKQACAAGDARTCGDLLGLFGDKPLASGEFAFARDHLARRCAAKEGDACWVLSGLYWLGKGTARNRAKAGQYIERACRLDKSHCDVRDRWRAKAGFFEDLGPLPTLDLEPLVEQAKKTR